MQDLAASLLASPGFWAFLLPLHLLLFALIARIHGLFAACWVTVAMLAGALAAVMLIELGLRALQLPHQGLLRVCLPWPIAFGLVLVAVKLWTRRQERQYQEVVDTLRSTLSAPLEREH